ncbi:uncharacterized protein LOC143180144 [Calliopsis andreniformis]|uniref:uncharacterized protein LOC143180144 n=1 Tax=Calliopsis andreniformis TaxID=337506 RepID=UPI003FCC78F1
MNGKKTVLVFITKNRAYYGKSGGAIKKYVNIALSSIEVYGQQPFYEFRKHPNNSPSRDSTEATQLHLTSTKWSLEIRHLILMKNEPKVIMILIKQEFLMIYPILHQWMDLPSVFVVRTRGSWILIFLDSNKTHLLQQ